MKVLFVVSDNLDEQQNEDSTFKLGKSFKYYFHYLHDINEKARLQLLIQEAHRYLLRAYKEKNLSSYGFKKQTLTIYALCITNEDYQKFLTENNTLYGINNFEKKNILRNELELPPYDLKTVQLNSFFVLGYLQVTDKYQLKIVINQYAAQNESDLKYIKYVIDLHSNGEIFITQP